MYKFIGGMVDTEGKPDRGLAVVVGVDIFNVVNDGIEKVGLSDSASRNLGRDMSDMYMEVDYKIKICVGDIYLKDIGEVSV